MLDLYKTCRPIGLLQNSQILIRYIATPLIVMQLLIKQACYGLAVTSAFCDKRIYAKVHYTIKKHAVRPCIRSAEEQIKLHIGLYETWAPHNTWMFNVTRPRRSHNALLYVRPSLRLSVSCLPFTWPLWVTGSFSARESYGEIKSRASLSPDVWSVVKL